MAIANPSSDIMMNLAAASDLLLNKAGADLNYINRMAEFDAKKKLICKISEGIATEHRRKYTDTCGSRKKQMQ